MKKGIIALLATAVLSLPIASLAASHNMDHSSMAEMNHGEMMKDAAVVMLPEQTVDGVTATVHLKDVKATMAKMGMKETHHFMVLFRNAKDGKAITEGSAAVKIKWPDGVESSAIKLMGMEGHFGADVVLDKKGYYVFTVGTQLSDGVKRQFVVKSEFK